MTSWQWIGIIMVAVPLLAGLSWVIWEAGLEFIMEILVMLVSVVTMAGLITVGSMLIVGALP